MSSFAKAKQLLRLATMAAGRHLGVSISDVIEEFGGVERTAQRMLRALEEQFPETTTSFDHENRKRWRLPPAALRDLMTLTAEELTALDLAHEALKREGRSPEAEDLARLKDKVLTLAPRARVVRLETDHEALLEAQGLAARPGPRPQVDAKVVAVVSEAIKACRVLEVAYRSWGDAEPRLRQIEPYGVLTGLRRYIVALPRGEAIAGRKPFLGLFAKLVRSQALDAIEWTEAEGVCTARHVERFLASLSLAGDRWRPGIGLGEELHFETKAASGLALRHEGRLVHLVAFRGAASAPVQ